MNVESSLFRFNNQWPEGCTIERALLHKCHEATEAFAIESDRNDPLGNLRDLFYIPSNASGESLIYLSGHSLGLQPKATKKLVFEELDAWANDGVEGHFKENAPWFSYHTLVRNSLAALVGASPKEVVAMNSLTVNLHLMMVSFYQPTLERHKILMEAPVFSSDTYAVKSQIKYHGYDPDEALIIISPRPGEDIIRMEDVNALIDQRGEEIALVLLSGVNYFTGQLVDMKQITQKAHEKGSVVGFDLAHAIGNVVLSMHDWDVDFAVWCTYKYLNSGPGAIGGAFVHERHIDDISLPRFAGWWGNDPNTRFDLHLQPEFTPTQSADGWQLSNPSIFSLAPMRAALEIFDQVGMEALREKSVKLTGYLEFLLDQIQSDRIKVITPRNPGERGSQLSIRVEDRPEELLEKLRAAGIVPDFRRPNVIRVTPIASYNTFHDVWKFADILSKHLEQK